MMKWAVWMALAVLVTPPAPDRSPIAHFVAGRAPAPLTVVSASGKSQVLTDAGWRKLPRQTVKAKDHAGVVATYEGVTVATVLQGVGVPIGKELRGRRLADCLLVEEADGYRVAFSLAEIDPAMSEGVVLAADGKDGKPLDAKEGRYRLVAPATSGRPAGSGR